MYTSIALPHYSLTIFQEEKTAFDPPENCIFLQEPDVMLNILTKIVITGESLTRTLYFHRGVHWGGENLGFALIEETATLFIGSGGISAAIDLRNNKIIRQHEVLLFWEFKQIRGWILELGEVDCFLHSPTGTLIAAVPVDPPYEYTITDEGIRIATTLFGIQWLRFPQP